MKGRLVRARFSLIECLMVICIIFILATFALPAYSRVKKKAHYAGWLAYRDQMEKRPDCLIFYDFRPETDDCVHNHAMGTDNPMADPGILNADSVTNAVSAPGRWGLNRALQNKPNRYIFTLSPSKPCYLSNGHGGTISQMTFIWWSYTNDTIYHGSSSFSFDAKDFSFFEFDFDSVSGDHKQSHYLNVDDTSSPLQSSFSNWSTPRNLPMPILRGYRQPWHMHAIVIDSEINEIWHFYDGTLAKYGFTWKPYISRNGPIRLTGLDYSASWTPAAVWAIDEFALFSTAFSEADLQEYYRIGKCDWD